MAVRFDFSGKRVLVTGASQGIGRALCVALSEAGAEVYALARNQTALLQLHNETPRIHPLVGDVTASFQELTSLLENVEVDYLVNNAGIAVLEGVRQVSEEAIDRTLAVNVRGPLLLSRVVSSRWLAAGRGGSIVMLSSQASLRPIHDHVVYCSSKAALDMAARCLAMELGPHGIRVNCVNPTVVLTEMGRANWSDPAKANTLLSQMSVPHFAEEVDVVNAVLFLLSDASGLTTGHALPVDGGFTTR